ncbi:PASTA domain-containing protein [Actinokineospora sp. NBRC 105648]|uniref:PASTA domain-containing protein n=1 Tax=Actinokineospora sp. NBRC 105648 TaxID=3032206 RepID=UPI0033245092
MRVPVPPPAPMDETVPVSGALATPMPAVPVPVPVVPVVPVLADTADSETTIRVPAVVVAEAGKAGNDEADLTVRASGPVTEDETVRAGAIAADGSVVGHPDGTPSDGLPRTGEPSGAIPVTPPADATQAAPISGVIPVNLAAVAGPQSGAIPTSGAHATGPNPIGPTSGGIPTSGAHAAGPTSGGIPAAGPPSGPTPVAGPTSGGIPVGGGYAVGPQSGPTPMANPQSGGVPVGRHAAPPSSGAPVGPPSGPMSQSGPGPQGGYPQFPQSGPQHTHAVVRPVPAGFSAAGPQGTRAMLRSDLEKVIDSAAANPMHTGPHPAPYATGGFPAQQQQSYQQHPGTGPQPVGPPSRTRRIILLSVVGVLLLGLLGTGIWWFSSGRYTEVPSVGGQESAAAEQAVRGADLSPQVTTLRDNKIEAGLVISTDPAPGTEALRGDTVKLVVSAGRPVVPDVQAGVTREEAEQAVRAEELQPQPDDGKNVFDDKIPKGRVVGLDPPAGTKLDIGQRVVVVLSKGPAPKPVPDVRGKTRDEAFQTLQQAGFEPFDGQPEFAPDIDGGRVVRTDPPANTKIEATAAKRVSVIVSNAVVVPDVSGRSVQEAQTILGQVGLQIDLQPFSNPNGRVFNQSPGAGSRAQKGDKVTVFAF